MADYRKQWLSVEEQLQKLASRRVAIPNDGSGVQRYGRRRLRVLNNYRDGTSLEDAAAIIDFDRKLRMLILDGIERIEVSLRMQIGYTLGCRSAFAHLEPATFVSAFTAPPIDDCTGQVGPSKHALWIARMRERQNASDEAFVAHFRDNYNSRMPIWAATEIMEMGHLSRLYGGLVSSIASEIALAYGAPSKRVMNSWIASLNYVRNVAAHHARIFNRKLVTAPKRPGKGQVPILDHLLEEKSSKQVFGLYNALAVMAYLLRAIDEDADWTRRVVELVKAFPTAGHLTEESMGMPQGWASLELWQA